MINLAPVCNYILLNNLHICKFCIHNWLTFQQNVPYLLIEYIDLLNIRTVMISVLRTCRLYDEPIRCGPVLMIPRYLPIKLLKMLTQQFKVKAETLKFTISIFRDYLKQELCAIKTSDNPLFGRFWFKVDSSSCLQGHCFLGEIERDLVRKTTHGTAGSTATPTATMSIRVTVGQGN